MSNTAFQNNLAPTTKGDVGLGNVDNTSDANKPISTVAQAALDLLTASVAASPQKPISVTVPALGAIAGLPAGRTALSGTNYITNLDLTECTQIYLSVNRPSVNDTGAKIVIMGKTGIYSTNPALYLEFGSGTSEVSVDVGTAGAVYTTGWVDMNTDLQSSAINVQLFTEGGNGILSPVLGVIHYHFR